MRAVRCLGFVAITVLLTGPVLARDYRCTNIMGGNPFGLSIAADGSYQTRPFAEARIKIEPGGGRVELAEIGSYYRVLDGPLLDQLQVDTIHIMSGSRLTPSGSSGLFDCTKAK